MKTADQFKQLREVMLSVAQGLRIEAEAGEPDTPEAKQLEGYAKELEDAAKVCAPQPSAKQGGRSERKV